MEFLQRDPADAVRAAFPNPGVLSFDRSANRSIESSRPRDIFDIWSEEAASSVEPDVEDCTSSRMRSMA
jgi:hypothetical protein